MSKRLACPKCQSYNLAVKRESFDLLETLSGSGKPLITPADTQTSSVVCSDCGADFGDGTIFGFTQGDLR